MSAVERMRVGLGGLLRGSELAGEALVSIDEHAVELETPRGRLVLPLSRIDGLRLLGDALELYLDSGDVVHLARAPELPTVAAEVARLVCTVPEMTRSLRGFGARRGASGNEHDRFFAALLDARRAAERAPNLVALRAAFDAPALRGALARQLQEFAGERYPDDAPERRALEAELGECAAGLMRSLASLEHAQQVLGASDDSERFVRWREWASALRGVYESADGCWLTVRPVLAEERRARPRRWRRWFSRGRRG